MTVNSLTGEMEKNPSGDRRLFGGSMTAEIPGAFIDVSQIRQIPDSQEVFVDMESNHSIVIELLEMDSTSENENPSRFHFEQLAIDNDASDFSRIHLSKKINIDEFSAARLSSEAQMWIVIGTQLISKFHHRTPRDIVNIYLALIRLPQCATDILITYNQPMATCEDESLYDTVLNDMSSILRQAISDDSEDYPVPAEPSSEQAIHSVYNIWWNALSTFTIVDQSIFCD